MKKVNIELNDKRYRVEIAITDEQRAKGLQNRAKLPISRGMLFPYPEPSHVQFWMKDTHIPLNIVFIDEDWNVIKVTRGEPLSEQMLKCDDVSYVLELNSNVDVEEDDYVDLDEAEEWLMREDFYDDIECEDDEEIDCEVDGMLVLDDSGNVQMKLEGGERIFSRKNTKTLISMAKRAERSMIKSDYKRLGSKIFQYLKIQDEKDPDYVALPDKD